MTARHVVEGFRLPDTGELTENEYAWVGFIRAASQQTDPAPCLVGVQALRRVLNPGCLATPAQGQDERNV